jgi:hypothetical protein
MVLTLLSSSSVRTLLLGFMPALNLVITEETLINFGLLGLVLDFQGLAIDGVSCFLC